MKKKVLIMLGSANKNGATNKILKIIVNKISLYCDFIFFNSYEQAIKPCDGCRLCDKKIICKHKDFSAIKKILETCNFIIIASPIYNMGLPSPLKAIFDRFQPYYAARFLRKENLLKPKKGILILTSGKNNKLGFEYTNLQIKTALKSINAEIISEIFYSNTDKNLKFTQKILKDIEKEIKKITNILRTEI